MNHHNVFSTSNLSILKNILVLAVVSAFALIPEHAFAQKRVINYCQGLDVVVIKQNPQPTKSGQSNCCYKVRITKGKKTAKVPVRFEISTKNPTKIISTYGVSSLLLQEPNTIPPTTNKVSFRNKIAQRPQRELPSGVIDVATLCLDATSTTWLYFSWIDRNNQVFCRDSVEVYCETATQSCCPLSLNFSNAPNNPNKYKYVEVSATGGCEIINADPDNWIQAPSFPNSVRWYPPDKGNIPAGETIDNDFMVYLSPNQPVQHLTVKWYDQLNKVACTQLIDLPCNKVFSPEEDWTAYTSLAAPFDPSVFVFAVKEEEEDTDCGEDENDFKTHDCEFTYKIECTNSTKYKLSLTGPDGHNIYHWKVFEGLNTTAIAQTTGQTPNPIVLSGAGIYKIELTAVITNGSPALNDSCYTVRSIDIPVIKPNFDYKKLDCTENETMNLTYEFTALDLPDITSYQSIHWKCVNSAGVEMTGFPATGQTVTCKFTVEGSYTVTIRIIDAFGCEFSKSKPVEVTNACIPDFSWEYYFCECPIAASNDQIKVTFKNLSQGGYCPVTYTWDFGDGSPVQTTSNVNQTVDHFYPVNTNDCQQGIFKKYPVKLRMEDSKAPPCKVNKTYEVSIQPCRIFFKDIKVCPDGKITISSNVKGMWSVSGSASIITALSDQGNTKDCITMAFNESGQYTIVLDGKCETGGRCRRDTVINVEVMCCAKNDVIRDDAIFEIGNDRFKVKYKFSQRQLPSTHRINVKTKLYKQKTNKRGHTFYRGYKADEIESSFDGTVYYRDTHADVSCNHILDGCNCVLEDQVSGIEIKNNSNKVKLSKKMYKSYRSRVNTLKSTHRIKIGGETRVFSFLLGIDCDQYHTISDWY